MKQTDVETNESRVFLGMEDLSRQVEAQFWAAYARRIWEMVKLFSTEACYGCSHKKVSGTDHTVCQLEDNELIKKFLTKADKRINRAQIVEDWRNALKQIFYQIRKFVLDFKGQFADSNESKSGQIKLQRLFSRKSGFLCQIHKVKCINFGEIPSRPEI